MKADRDDAPYRAWERDSGKKRVTSVAIAGCLITGIAIFIGYKFIPNKADPLNVQDSPYESRYEFTELPQQTGPTAEEIFWADQRKREQAQREEEKKAQARQTVFNDSNYEPKGAINVVSTEGIRESEAYEQEESRERTIYRNIEHMTTWIKGWNGGTSYQVSWTSINNHIDGRTVCNNFRRGSIDYRECRKAAKQHFHEECRTWRARYKESRSDQSDSMKTRYCVAASSFSPMG